MKLLIIIPCLRERDRLPAFLPDLLAALTSFQNQVEVLAVDDGSGPEQQAWLTGYCAELSAAHPHPFLRPPLLLPENAGKGGAVYAGWAAAGPEVTHLAFVDADGAVPPGEVARLAALIIDANSAVFAIRTGEEGTTVTRTPARRIAGQIFRGIVKTLFRFPLADTQCGFKIVPANAWRACADGLLEKRFCFDVDLTWHLLHRKIPLRAVPIDWLERPGSRLHAGSLWAMIQSLVALRGRLGNWRAPGEASP